MDFAKLREPFFPDELEWKPQSVGKSNGRIWVRALAYITNRAIMDRLDTIIGPQNWKNEFKDAPDGGVLCGLSIKIENEWITKWDGAENTDIEAVKGGLSNSMKRAAVQWGIGRYLYDLEETFGEVTEAGICRSKTKEGEWFNWNPPKLPPWALPGASEKKVRQEMPPREAPKAEAPEGPSAKYLATKDWLNEHHAELTKLPVVREIRKLFDAARNDSEKLDAVLTMAKTALGLS